MENRPENLKSKIEIINRKLQYKKLIDFGGDLSKKIESTDIVESFNDILEIVNTCKDLGDEFMTNTKTEHAGEYLLDAQVVKMSYDLMGVTTEKLANTEFSDRQFVESLLNFLTVDQGYEDFNLLAEESAKSYMGVRYSLSMLGTFDREEKTVVAKQKRERQKREKTAEVLKKPENISALKQTEKGAEKIRNYHKQIEKICDQRDGKIPYFELITNPHDLMQTIDNAFQVAFLVRDNFLSLVDIDDEPYVCLVDEQEKATQSQISSVDTAQCVSVITAKMFKKNIERFKIKKPLLVPNSDECGEDTFSQSLAEMEAVEDDLNSDSD